MSAIEGTPVALWLAVIASGLYHGLNPGMGWPLAVSAGMLEQRSSALWGALGALAGGHLGAMLVALLPFALLAMLIAWQWWLQVAAGAGVAGFGVWLLLSRRHPRALARIPPTRLALWSFAIALAHGAGLMLIPVYLGLCAPSPAEPGHAAAAALMGEGIGTAVAVGLVHTLAMVAAGGAIAWLVYTRLGPGFIARSWLNLDRLWASSLVLVGGLSLAMQLS